MSDKEFGEAEQEKQALIQQAQATAQQQPQQGGGGNEMGIDGENAEVFQ